MMLLILLLPLASQNDILPVILGAGAASFIAAVGQFVLGLRASAETRESKAIGNLEKWRQDADDRAGRALVDLDHERAMVAYLWRRVSLLERHIVLHGDGSEPPDPGPPPSKVNGVGEQAKQQAGELG